MSRNKIYISLYIRKSYTISGYYTKINYMPHFGIVIKYYKLHTVYNKFIEELNNCEHIK